MEGWREGCGCARNYETHTKKEGKKKREVKGVKQNTKRRPESVSVCVEGREGGGG